MKFTIAEMKAKLPIEATEKWPDGVWDIKPFEKDGVRLVFFAPKGQDHQTTHEEDEFYFIARGTGRLLIDGENNDFKAGDAFFVPANVEHRFEDFTDDFATWAIFF